MVHPPAIHSSSWLKQYGICGPNKMEDHIITQDSVKSCGILSKDDEREKVKDFVYKHFREVKDHSVPIEHGSARSNRPLRNKGHCRVQQGAFFSGKILSFGCSICKDSSTYSPNDLLKHFRLAHRGALPTYPCDLCGFVTNDFSVLQRHRIEHRNTLVTCELCQDGVQYSLLLLTRHYTMCHSLNGQFTCDSCHFSTVDAGTFVQHIHHHKETSWKCSMCTHVSMSEVEHQKHLKGHSGTFPFTCEICGYGAARNEYLKKHMAAVHKSEKKSVWTAIEDNGALLNSSASLKLLLKKTSPLSEDSKEDDQMSNVNTNDKLLSVISSDEVHQLSHDTLAKRDNRNGSNNKLEISAADMLQEAEHSISPFDSDQTSPNGMTVVRINVSYMKPAGEKPANTGIVLGSNSKIIGVPAGKAAALLTSKQGISSSSNHFLITSDLKRPLLLPRTLNSTPTDKTTKTCYVLQRSLPMAQASQASGLRLAGTQLSLNSRPLLAMPASTSESTGNLQSGRQTFLLRYVSSSNNEETKGTKAAGPCTQPTDNAGSKVFFKIVSPPNSLLSNATPVSRSHPVLLATRPQTQCFLLSQNSHSSGIKKFIAVQNSSKNFATKASVLQSPAQLSEADKPILAPRPVRPPSQRKRRRKLLFDELPATGRKVRKLSNKPLPEKDSVVLWSPIAKDQERTLRLSPLNSDQQVKWPRRCQPVVVLNHPDVDIPEVASIMKVVQRHGGMLLK
ncbi:hypothetical protein WMY93_010774 [Mugilogobius chulae]|uniref:C2H2-type domain-containing protein n=1 Tax=Mugilogobius chulae TaxID=88201 RepID=A0AAW0P8M3_9GOBI